jgi:uncharacterized surface protein with fasciclin (FAS1) repeats
MMNRIARGMLWLPLVALLAGCDDEPTAPAPGNLVQVAQAVNQESGEFSVLLAAVTAAGLADALSGSEQRTVFAPTDAAFAELGLDAGAVAGLPQETLTNILLYHVAAGRLPATSVLATSQLTMANGGVAEVRLQGGNAFIGDARIVQTDIAASNGVIHVIDRVLMP